MQQSESFIKEGKLSHKYSRVFSQTVMRERENTRVIISTRVFTMLGISPLNSF